MRQRTTNPHQTVMVSLDQLVPKDHTYRKFLLLINFKHLVTPLNKRVKNQQWGAIGYGMETLFKCLVLQFMKDLSDRELAQYLQESTAAKLFCGFELTEKTPHFSLFSQIRTKIGASQLSKIFVKMRKQLEKKGYLPQVFTFVDASYLISKSNLWEERDQLLQQKYEKMNNETLPLVAHDKEARIGCKGKKKYWYGYKRHNSVDMQSGLINKVAITPANLTDAAGLKYICPKQGAVYGDKGYCVNPATEIIHRHNCHNATIKKANMLEKNPGKDRWLSGIRAPYERIFSKVSKRVRYVGVLKNQFMATLEAFCFNLKRLLVLEAPPLFAD